MSTDYNRNAAIQISIIDPETGRPPEGPARLLAVDDSLLVAFSGSIFKMLPPEIIDPNGTDSTTRPAYQKVYDIGSSNPYVARSILQAIDMLNSVILRENLDADSIKEQVWKCSKLLLKCEKAHYDIYQQTTDKLHECDAIIEQNKNEQHIPSLPQVADLEEKVMTFFSYAKKLLIEIYRLISLFFDAPDVEANFPKMHQWLAENKPENEELIRMLKEDQVWTDIVRYCRNAIEHPKDKYKVEINNFQLYPGNKFTDPCWRYDLRAKNGPIREGFVSIILEFNVYLENLLTFLEQVFILCITKNWNLETRFHFQITKIPDDKINRDCPIIYRAIMQFD